MRFRLAVALLGCVLLNGIEAFAFQVGTNPEPTVTIVNTQLQAGVVGETYKQTLMAAGGKPPYTWAVVGQFPKGITVDGNGNFGGVPKENGTWTFRTEVTDSEGSTTWRGLELVVTGKGSPIIQTPSIPDGEAAQRYASKLEADGVTPLTWAIAKGALPKGIVLQATGDLSGVPSTSGTYEFSAKVTDRVGRSTLNSYSFQIQPPSTQFLSTLGPWGQYVVFQILHPLIIVMTPLILLAVLVIRVIGQFRVGANDGVRSLLTAVLPLVVIMPVVIFQSSAFVMLRDLPTWVTAVVAFLLGGALMAVMEYANRASPTIPVSEFLLSATCCLLVFSVLIFRQEAPLAGFYGVVAGCATYVMFKGIP